MIKQAALGLILPDSPRMLWKIKKHNNKLLAVGCIEAHQEPAESLTEREH